MLYVHMCVNILQQFAESHVSSILYALDSTGSPSPLMLPAVDTWGCIIEQCAC